jgi:hypothetical protein
MTPSSEPHSSTRQRGLAHKVWHDPVGSKVIAAVIIAAPPSVAAAIYKCREAILSILDAGWKLLADATVLPNWLLILLALNALGTISLLTIRRGRERLRTGRPTG